MRNLYFFPLLLLVAGCGKSPSTSNTGDAAAAEPTAAVRTVKLQRGVIASTVTAYGAVVAQPGETESVSVQYECRVVRLLVSAGQPVEKEQPLIEIEPSPDAKLALQQARTAEESSRMQLEATKKRFAMNLAVNTEVDQAVQIARDAAARLASLEERGADGRATLGADLVGIVSAIDVNMGQIVAAGGSLLSIVPENQIEVRLGVEPEDAGRLNAGAKVRVFVVNQDGIEATGRIRLVARRVNPQTRLIDTFVTVPPDPALLIDGYVRAEIVVEEKEAFIVPRDAVLPGVAGGSVLFTVRDGHAVRHTVSTGLETDEKTEVSGETLREGDAVVIVGNSQLEDGMAVVVGNAAP